MQVVPASSVVQRYDYLSPSMFNRCKGWQKPGDLTLNLASPMRRHQLNALLMLVFL